MYKSKNINVVFEILQNEVDGDVTAALEKMAANYSMTWMYEGTESRFPESATDFKTEMQKEVYPIKGRTYEIKHVAEGVDVVMVELVESYPDPETQQMHRTPLVLVLEMKDGKILKGRHYCDPRLSYKDVSTEELEKAYKGTQAQKIIK